MFRPRDISKFGDRSQGWPEGPNFDSYYTSRGGRFSFPRIDPLYPWSLPYNAVLSKVASITIFWVFGMTRPGIEPRSPGPLVNTLTIMPMSSRHNVHKSWRYHNNDYVKSRKSKKLSRAMWPNFYFHDIWWKWIKELN